MRASPYDLTQYGYEAIMIETSSGRATYVARQREISLRAQNLRSDLIAVLETARPSSS